MITFSKEQFVSFLSADGPRKSFAASLLIGRKQAIDPELAQSLADIILLQALQKGIIVKQSKKALHERYSLAVAPHELA